MKILQVNSLFAPNRYGGAEALLERLSESLSARGHDVHVACLSASPAQRQHEPLPVHEFVLRNVYWPFDGRQRKRVVKAVWHLRNTFGQGGAADIAALVRQLRPDIVHTHNLSGFTTATWQAIRSQGIPVVHTVHDYALLCPTTTMLRDRSNCEGQCLGCRLLSWPKPRQSQAVSAVVGCSAFVLEQHLRAGYFSAATRHVILNSDPYFEGAVPLRPLDVDKLRIGYLGRLAAPKGIEVMLDALSQAGGRWELHVAGKGDPHYEAQLRERYEPRGVNFLGRIDAGAFLKGIDLLVVPSLWNEPCPLVLGEAANAGVPVVASSVGGIPEVVAQGQTGLLFAPGDGRALVEHVARLAADRSLLQSMSAAARRRAGHYSFESMVDRYVEVYAETLQLTAQHDDVCLTT